ncbi:Ribonuclease H-like domain containing protein [Melia azedarach]|uniref:Ribonuclease H-like domain containing protein n=1 Tax=Melia azedarach TaxID=155640 RepID=A0ACC1YF84_MELAZ|nr:Ribonuclease H-like domain containing protein [Melia azedarach]
MSKERTIDFMSFGRLMADQLTKSELELLIMISWSIWHSRNSFIYGGDCTEPRRICTKAEAMLEEFQSACLVTPQAQKPCIAPRPTTWVPPRSGWFKLNVDAAIKVAAGCAGLGAIVRNEEGKVLVAAVYRRIFFGDVEYAEVEVILNGLKLAMEAGLTPLIVESDCLNVVNLILKHIITRGEIEFILSYIRSLVAGQKQIVFNHIYQ